jgi:hypothetical protein
MNRGIWAALMLTTAALVHAQDASELAPSGAVGSKDYARFAGDPVKQIRFASLQGWEPIDREHVVLFTRYTEAWLLDLAGPCLDVKFAYAISVTSFGNRIHSGFDKLLVGQQECRISQIRPVDMDAYHAAKREAEGASLEAGLASELLHAKVIVRDADPAIDQTDSGAEPTPDS